MDKFSKNFIPMLKKIPVRGLDEPSGSCPIFLAYG